MVVSTEDESDSDQKNNKVGPGTFSIGRDHSSMNGQREGFLALSSTMSALVNARHAPTNRVWNDSEVDPSSPRETKHLPPSPLVTPPVGMVFRSTERGDAVASHCDSSHLAEGASILRTPEITALVVVHQIIVREVHRDQTRKGSLTFIMITVKFPMRVDMFAKKLVGLLNHSQKSFMRCFTQ